MPLRLDAAHVLTQDDSDRWLSPGVVEVEGDRITWVGTPEEATGRGAPDAARTLPGVLLPGFVNTHAHSAMTLLRGAGEGLPVDRWLREVMWPRETALLPADVHWGMTLGAAQLLLGGITTSVEMYFQPEVLARAGAAAGLRTVVCAPVTAAPARIAPGAWRTQLDQAVELAEAYTDDPLIEVGLGPHSAYALPTEPLAATITTAATHGLLLHTHVAEGEREDDRITAAHGVSVPRYLADLGVLETRCILAHGVWLTSADIELLASGTVGIAHCPCSNARHASGLAPVRDLRAAGIPVGIATDGPASHQRLDPFEEARTAIRLARLRERDAATLSAADALRMLTREAAAALGRDDLGVLAPGARADLIHVIPGPHHSPLVDAEDLRTHLVWSSSPADVHDVWVAGRPVVSAGRVETVDVPAALAEVTARAHRLAGRSTWGSSNAGPEGSRKGVRRGCRTSTAPPGPDPEDRT